MCRGIRIIVRFVHVIPSLVIIFDEATLKDSRVLSFLIRFPIDYALHGKNRFFSFFCFSLTLHAIYAYIRVLLTNRFFPLHDYLNYVTIESIELRNHVSLFHCFIFFSWFFFFHK